MAFTEALRMLITADTGQAVTSIRAVGQTTQKELGNSTKSIDKWSRGLTVAGAGMVAVGAAALVGLGHAAKAASDLGEAVNASNVVFGEATGVIDKYAKDSATSMGLSERAFRESTTVIGAMLQNFGFDADTAAEKSVELAQRAADMASVFNTDVSEALAAIQAGLRGEADPLERFGVGLNEAAVNAKAMELGLADSTTEVDAAAKTQARLALIMEQTSKFQGDFANTSDSLANRQRTLAAQFENLKAAIGEGALPVFETFLDVAGKAVGVFSSLDSSTQGAIGKFTAFGAVGLIVAGGVSIVIGQLLKMRTNFVEAAAAVGKLRTSMSGLAGAGGIAGVAIALGAAAVATANFLKNQNEAKVLEGAEAFAKLRDNSKEAAAATGLINDAVKVSTIDFTASASAADTLAESGKFTEQAMRDLDQGFAALLEKAPHLADEFIKSAEAKGVDADAIRRWKGELEGKVDADAEAINSQEEYNAAVEDATGTTEDATSALQEYSDTLKGLTDPVFAAMDAVRGIADAQLAEHDAAVAVMEAQHALNEAREGGNADEVAEAERGLADAQRQLSEAQWNTVTSAAEADAALAGLKDAVDKGDVSVSDFQDTLATWVRQGFLTQDQAYRAAAAVGALGDQASDADKKRVDIPVTTPGSPRARSELRGVRDRAFDIPKSRSTRVSTSGTGPSAGALRNVRDAANGIPRNITINVAAQGAAAARIALSKLGGRQHGGPALAGEMYVVGEAGPEILLMGDRSGQIVPNVGRPAGTGVAMAAGGGGGVTNVHFHMEGAIITSKDDAARWVAQAWNKASRVGLVNR